MWREPTCCGISNHSPTSIVCCNSDKVHQTFASTWRNLRRPTFLSFLSFLVSGNVGAGVSPGSCKTSTTISRHVDREISRDLTSNRLTHWATPVYFHGFLSHTGLSSSSKYGIGSRGANSARRSGGRYWVMPTLFYTGKGQSPRSHLARVKVMRRSVSFVERLELQFKGNVFSQAVCLGDVDNDGVSVFWRHWPRPLARVAIAITMHVGT